ALDTDRRLDFVDLLRRECASLGAALLFVSHDAALATRFDRRTTLAELNRAGEGTA
ncbi:MAG: ABC transporter ATP-binding protein, partial [Pseudomonadales bacterium]|nr:ABC transporter ATP-binding protein [Pseudomonadales bacterium]